MFFLLQRYALKMDDVLLETAGRCRAVICCRVTPLQKVQCIIMYQCGYTVTFQCSTEKGC